jgi:hypothetical protein
MTDKSGSSLPTREKALRGKRAMIRSTSLHSTIQLLWPSPEMGLATLEPVDGATDAGETTPPKEGPAEWSKPVNVAAPNAHGTGVPPTEPASRAEAGQGFAGGPMSERPEGRHSAGGALPTYKPLCHDKPGIPSVFGAPGGRALIGGGNEGAHAEPLDVLGPPCVLDAGAAFTVGLVEPPCAQDAGAAFTTGAVGEARDASLLRARSIALLSRS